MPLMPHFSTISAYDKDRAQLTFSLVGKDAAARLPIADAFCRKYPRDDFANYLVANTLVEMGKPLLAIPYAQKAVQFGNFEPLHVAQLIDIYSSHFFYEQIDLLLPLIQASGKSSALLDMAIGTYFLNIGKADHALTHLQRARTSADSAVSEVATLQIVACLRNANRNEEARDLLVEMTLIPARRSTALIELSQFTKDEELKQIEAQMEDHLSNIASGIVSDDGAQEPLLLQLGRIREKRGEFDAAFTHWQRSRALVPVTYDARSYDRFIKDLKSFYRHELFERMAPYSNLDESLVFAVGMPRSGTTLVAQILSSHHNAASAGELVRLPREALFFLQKYHVSAGLKQLVADAGHGEIKIRTEEFLKLAQLVAGRPAQRIIDKTPTQFLHAGYIHLCFPKAKFINIIRHPADIFISTYQNDFTHDYTFAFDQVGFAHYYLKRQDIMRYWKKLFPENILDVLYEELTQSPEPQVRRILDFLGLEWDPACLKFFERSSSVLTFSRDQVRSAINTKSVDRWRNYEKHLGPLFEVLEKAGYSYPASEA